MSKSEAVIGVGVVILVVAATFGGGPMASVYAGLGVLVIVAGFLFALVA